MSKWLKTIDIVNNNDVDTNGESGDRCEICTMPFFGTVRYSYEIALAQCNYQKTDLTNSGLIAHTMITNTNPIALFHGVCFRELDNRLAEHLLLKSISYQAILERISENTKAIPGTPLGMIPTAKAMSSLSDPTR